MNYQEAIEKERRNKKKKIQRNGWREKAAPIGPLKQSPSSHRHIHSLFDIKKKQKKKKRRENRFLLKTPRWRRRRWTYLRSRPFSTSISIRLAAPTRAHSILHRVWKKFIIYNWASRKKRGRVGGQLEDARGEKRINATWALLDDTILVYVCVCVPRWRNSNIYFLELNWISSYVLEPQAAHVWLMNLFRLSIPPQYEKCSNKWRFQFFSS